MPAQIVHLAVKVENIEGSREFYEKIFGFEHTGTRRAGPLKDHISCWLTDGQIGFTLIEYDSEDAPEAKAAGKGPCIHHFGIAVPPEEFEDYIKMIKATGCEIISPPGVNPMKFRAPGGVIAEVGTPDVFPR
jgi:catechol 2,3-dioxygenase-like lactoylglutathione lyase family enzyme